VAGILLDHVMKEYSGGVRAVDGVQLEIEPGEFLVLVGPSGCGKSTLLRMIAGLEEVTSGTICIGGDDVTDLPPRARDIAMVFQTYALYPHMSERQNLAYGLKVRKTPKAESARRVEEVAGLLGLDELLDQVEHLAARLALLRHAGAGGHASTIAQLVEIGQCHCAERSGAV
jgi:multiple sugar transport system ATP-binding protein